MKIHPLVSWLLPCSFLLCAPWLRAQSTVAKYEPAAPGLESAIESALGDESDDAALLEELDEYRRSPLDLRSAPAASLARLPGIFPADAERIIDAVHDPAVISYARLGSAAGLTRHQLSVLRAFTILEPIRTIRSRTDRPGDDTLYLNIRCRLAQDLQPRKGFTGTLQRVQPLRGPDGDSLGLDTVDLGPYYTGSRPALLTRILMSLGAIDAGVTFEKDAGEPILFSDTIGYSFSPREYVDPVRPAGTVRKKLGAFLSAHAGLSLAPLTVHLGDFSAEFGQGLVLYGGFGGGKGDAARGAYKSARGIVPYRSAGEALFFRGVAITLNDGVWLPERLRASAVVSLRSLDATVYTAVSPDGDTVQMAGSVYEDGYHRTRAELRRRDGLDETIVGGNLSYRFDGGRVGATGYVARTGAVIAGSQFYEYSGDRVAMVGLDGEYRSGPALFYGEAARSVHGVVGMIGGVNVAAGAVDLSLSARVIPAAFYTPHGVGFGESAFRQKNERGICLGLRSRLKEHGLLTAYLDLFQFPERTYQVPQPTSGTDGSLQFDYTPTPQIRLSARLHDKRRGESMTITDGNGRPARILFDRETFRARIEGEHILADDILTFRARIERTSVSYSGYAAQADGLLAFGDIRYRPFRTLSLGARGAWFQTDNYDAAVYEFEQELPGRSASATLSGRGHRFYLFASWRPFPALTVTAKYAETYYTDRSVISPGDLQQITGPRTNNLGLQLEWEP